MINDGFVVFHGFNGLTKTQCCMSRQGRGTFYNLVRFENII